MFSNNQSKEYTSNYWGKIKQIKEIIKNADAIVIGAGEGLAISSGLKFDCEKFAKVFPDLKMKLGCEDLHSAVFHEFENLSEYWAFFSKLILENRFNKELNDAYELLLNLVADKNYFVITTNVDHSFQDSGFSCDRLYFMQGDYGKMQCSKPCHEGIYKNEEIVRKMVEEQKDMKVPEELLPKCPKCGKDMIVNIRIDDRFVQNSGAQDAKKSYKTFIEENSNTNVLYLELGVGSGSPGIIKYPFWKEVYKNQNASYVCINNGESSIPKEIQQRSIKIKEDIRTALVHLTSANA